jgi:DNA-directed RNA polymerase subunit RPC12/RpoP
MILAAHLAMTDAVRPEETPEPPSLALRCPQCQFEAPVEEKENNPSTDRWFTCPSCGHKWSVSPIADSN